MTNMTQWDPISDLRSRMDRMFDEGFSRPWRFLPSADSMPAFPVEVWETEEAVELKASLPGVHPDDVDLSVTGDVLTIKAMHRSPAEVQQASYYRREIPYGSYTRSFNLPAEVDSGRARAEFELRTEEAV